MRARASLLPLPVSSASGARARPRWVADVEGESIFSLKTVGVWHERGGRRRTLEEQDGEGGYEQYVLFEALLGAQGAASTRFREGVLRLREKLEEDGVDMDAIGERPWYLDDDEALLEGLKSAGAAGFELPSGDNLRAAQEILDTELKASPDAARLARTRASSRRWTASTTTLRPAICWSACGPAPCCSRCRGSRWPATRWPTSRRG